MATMNGTELVLWSVSEAVGSLISVSSLSNLFNIEPHTNTFRFSGLTQRIGLWTNLKQKMDERAITGEKISDMRNRSTDDLGVLK
jgi:type II secretory pathway component GspD/PulD (secretin)